MCPHFRLLHLCAQRGKTRFPQRLWWCTLMAPGYLWPWYQASEKEAGGHSKHCVCVEAQERRLVFRGSRGLHLPSQHLWPVSVTAYLSQAATYRTPPPCLLLYLRPSLPAWPHQPTLVSFDFSYALLCLLAFPMQFPPFGIFLIWLTPLSVGVSALPETLNLN